MFRDGGTCQSAYVPLRSVELRGTGVTTNCIIVPWEVSGARKARPCGDIPICAGIHDIQEGVGHCAMGERSWSITRKGLSFYAANFLVAVSSTTDQNGLKCLGVFSPCIPLVDWLLPSQSVPYATMAPLGAGLVSRRGMRDRIALQQMALILTS